MRPPGPWDEGNGEPTLTAEPIAPAATDGGDAPQGPPAPDHESCTGGAGGNEAADGEAEAVVGGKPPQGTAEAGRTVGLLLGLAAGDAAGWPSARHRATRMPDWTRRLQREASAANTRN